MILPAPEQLPLSEPLSITNTIDAQGKGSRSGRKKRNILGLLGGSRQDRAFQSAEAAVFSELDPQHQSSWRMNSKRFQSQADWTESDGGDGPLRKIACRNGDNQSNLFTIGEEKVDPRIGQTRA